MTKLIKKYKNRRLYDTEKSQYITVDDLEQYVIDGITFRVEDAASGKDITSATLLQIFVEVESGSSQFLSPEILRQLIMWAHHPMQKAFKGMLEQFFTGMESAIQANPYFSDYKKSTQVWQQEIQQLVKQWQSIFKP